MNDIIIPISINGLTFKNPFYVASGPTVRTVRQIKRIEETGWAAASIKLSIDPAPYINRKPRYGYFPEYRALGFTAEKRLTFAEGLKLIEDAKKAVSDLLLFANITYAGDDDSDTRGWVNMAKQFESSGADVIEINMCCPNMSFNVDTTSGDKEASAKKTGASLGQDPELVAEIVRAIKKAVTVPVFVKLTPEGGQIAPIAKVLFAAGADAVGGTGNRLGIPPINIDDPSRSIYELQKEISMSCLSGPWLKPLALRDTYEIRKINGPGPFIMATGGVSGWQDAVEQILCGANLVGICTETLLSGYDIVRPMIRGLKSYMDTHGYTHPGDFCGALVSEVKTAADLTVYNGYAEIKENLYAPCKAACRHHIPIQALMRKTTENNHEGAWNLLAAAAAGPELCSSCDAPCEKACVRARSDEAVSIREVIRCLWEWGSKKGLTPAANESRSEIQGRAFKTVIPGNVLRRHGYIERKRRVVVDGSLNAQEEAKRCLNCGCGEGCGLCKQICCEFAPDIRRPDTLEIDKEACVACGMCFFRCPNKNIRMVQRG